MVSLKRLASVQCAPGSSPWCLAWGNPQVTVDEPWVNHAGWWFQPYPSEEYEFVNWDQLG